MDNVLSDASVLFDVAADADCSPSRGSRVADARTANLSKPARNGRDVQVELDERLKADQCDGRRRIEAVVRARESNFSLDRTRSLKLGAADQVERGGPLAQNVMTRSFRVSGR